MKKMIKTAEKVQNNRYLKAISYGFASLMPIIIVGALSVVIDQLGIEAYQEFLVNSGLKSYMAIPNIVTNGMLALFAAFSIAFHLADSYELDGFMAGFQGIISFLIVQPLSELADNKGWGYGQGVFGVEGIITAVILSIITVEIIRFVDNKGFYIQMPEEVPEMIQRSFKAIASIAMVVIILLMIKVSLAATSYDTFPNLIAEIIETPLYYLGSSWLSLAVLMAIVNLLWFFGINGHVVALSMILPTYLQMDLENLSAYQAGESLPNIIGNSFIHVYGSGAVVLFGLVISLIRLQSERYNTIGKLATVPMLFGIGEPLAFGVPYVMDFRLFFPVVFSASINVILAYFATFFGLIPRLNGVAIQGGMPVLFTGFIVGGWRVALFQVFLLLLNVVIWWPFVRVLDKDDALVSEEIT